MPDIPFSYESLNHSAGPDMLSFTHIASSNIARYFKRYLMLEALSVFDWTLPDTWDSDYFRYVLMGWGYLAVFKTDKFGVIPQQALLSGYNVFYRPTRAMVSNPHINTRELTINQDCTIIRLSPDYCGISDLVDNYGNMMALAYESGAINLINSHVSYVFPVDNEAQSQTMQAMFDNIASGHPAVFYKRRKGASTGKTLDPDWSPFEQNVGQNFITPDTMEVIRTLFDMFRTDLGIPVLSTRKKERVTIDEANRNTVETRCKVELFLEELQACIRNTLDMFPELDGQLAVKLRFPAEEVGGNAGAAVSAGAV